VVVLAGAGIAGGVLWYYGRDLPDLSDLREGYRPPQVTRIESSDGILLGEIFAERRIVVPFERIPRVLVEAVLAAEDADFYQHEGLDYPGMLRALFVNLREGSIRQGASTITQQVVQTFYVGRERTWSRKVRELLLARRLEQHLTKDEILFLYLNQINFGHARYGVQSASRFYFGHGVEEVTLEEAALLAGLPRGPAVYSPRIDLARARARRDWVLGQMERKGFATAEAVAAARAAEVRLGSEGEPEDLVPEIMVRVRQELVEAVGDEEVRLGGYVVRTTIDSRLQKAARRAVRDGLEALDGRHEYRVPIERRRGNPHAGRVQPGRTYLGRVVETDDREGNIAVQVGDVRGVVDVRAERRYNPEGLRASRAARAGALVRVSVRAAAEGGRPARLALELGPQAALVALEPETGRVRAIVGGYAPRRGDFDRATQARRQPGSSFKPIVYSLALNGRAVTPATLILDAPEVFDQWRPTNFETWSYEGHVRLRTALAKSINLVAVRLIQDVGPEQVASYARELGIESPLEAVPTLALGASAVTPLEMARAYAVFASGGLRAEPRIVEEIRGPDGRPHDLDTPETIRVIEPANAYLITSMLRSVVQNGTARDARVVGDEVAGKTGTSNDAQDAWFVGYARGLTCAVWVGFDEPRSLGRAESGSRAALPIWVSFMRDAPAAERLAVFTRPEGVVTALIDPESGLLAYEGQADAIEEEFLDGTVPTAQAIPPDTADPDTFLIEQTGDGAPAEDGNPNHPAPTASPSRGE
jgi:penicillin-binding protein 1A